MVFIFLICKGNQGEFTEKANRARREPKWLWVIIHFLHFIPLVGITKWPSLTFYHICFFSFTCMIILSPCKRLCVSIPLTFILLNHLKVRCKYDILPQNTHTITISSLPKNVTLYFRFRFLDCPHKIL